MPAGDHVVPIGKARIAREGKDLSIITYAATVWKALEAAEQLEKEDGLSVEVIDLRSLAPLDDEAIQATVRKTNRVLIVHEDTRTGGIAGEITARINETSFAWLDAPVLRVTAHDVPLPYAPSLEDFVLPQTADIVRAARTAGCVLTWRRPQRRPTAGQTSATEWDVFWGWLFIDVRGLRGRRNDRGADRQDRGRRSALCRRCGDRRAVQLADVLRSSGW